MNLQLNLRILFFLCFIIGCANTNAKVNDHVNRGLFDIPSKALKYQDVIDHYPLLVEGKRSSVDSFVSANNGFIRYFNRGLYRIDIETINATILNHNFNIEIEDLLVEGEAHMDVSRVHVNSDSVYHGLGDLNQPYTGDGVIIGVIDVGIDVNHQDFKNSNGSSRIRYVWDQLNNGNTPKPYNYGNECDWIDIEIGNCNHEEPPSGSGHGTTVAGIAAGNGNAVEEMRGIAPEADIIAVSIDFGPLFLSRVVDAIDYIFTKAKLLGKPCVINTSVGTTYGSHDGRDLAAQMIQQLIEEEAGRIVVASAGNSNNIDFGHPNASRKPFHLEHQLNNSHSFTWFTYSNTQSLVGFELWADSADFANVEFRFSNDDPNDFGRIDSTNWHSLSDYELTSVYTDYVFEDFPSGNLLVSTRQVDGLIQAAFRVNPNNTNDWWRFETRGTGRFDVWSGELTHSTSEMMFHDNLLPSIDSVPEMLNYIKPDFNKSVVSSWQCLDNVITVGNYTNRTTYIDHTGNLHDVNSESSSPQSIVGDIYATSSFGPTRDNRLKPDICAPGSTTLSVGNAAHVGALLNNGRTHTVDTSGFYNRQGGTSMSSPVVAGIAALYLQKHPNATALEFKDVMQRTAKQDQFTSDTIGNAWGYGKIDAYQMLTYEVIRGCTDPDAFNFDPTANIDDSTCVPVVLGCMDSSALNYNPLANTDTGGCDYDTIMNSIGRLNEIQLDIHPNPSAGYINLGSNVVQEGIYKVFNVSGKMVQQGKIQSSIELNSELENGTYIFTIWDPKQMKGSTNFVLHR